VCGQGSRQIRRVIRSARAVAKRERDGRGLRPKQRQARSLSTSRGQSRELHHPGHGRAFRPREARRSVDAVRDRARRKETN
jgi:hypothetical protein